MAKPEQIGIGVVFVLVLIAVVYYLSASSDINIAGFGGGGSTQTDDGEVEDQNDYKIKVRISKSNTVHGYFTDNRGTDHFFDPNLTLNDLDLPSSEYYSNGLEFIDPGSYNYLTLAHPAKGSDYDKRVWYEDGEFYFKNITGIDYISRFTYQSFGYEGKPIRKFTAGTYQKSCVDGTRDVLYPVRIDSEGNQHYFNLIDDEDYTNTGDDSLVLNNFPTCRVCEGDEDYPIDPMIDKCFDKYKICGALDLNIRTGLLVSKNYVPKYDRDLINNIQNGASAEYINPERNNYESSDNNFMPCNLDKYTDVLSDDKTEKTWPEILTEAVEEPFNIKLEWLVIAYSSDVADLQYVEDALGTRANDTIKRTVLAEIVDVGIKRQIKYKFLTFKPLITNDFDTSIGALAFDIDIGNAFGVLPDNSKLIDYKKAIYNLYSSNLPELNRQIGFKIFLSDQDAYYRATDKSAAVHEISETKIIMNPCFTKALSHVDENKEDTQTILLYIPMFLLVIDDIYGLGKFKKLLGRSKSAFEDSVNGYMGTWDTMFGTLIECCYKDQVNSKPNNTIYKDSVGMSKILSVYQNLDNVFQFDNAGAKMGGIGSNDTRHPDNSKSIIDNYLNYVFNKRIKVWEGEFNNSDYLKNFLHATKIYSNLTYPTGGAEYIDLPDATQMRTPNVGNVSTYFTANKDNPQNESAANVIVSMNDFFTSTPSPPTNNDKDLDNIILLYYGFLVGLTKKYKTL